MGTECSVDTCGSPPHAKDLCGKHYRRLLRRGTTDDPPKRGAAAEDMAAVRRARKPPTPVTCGHPDRKHAALGLCHPCYITRWLKEHPDSNSGDGWRKNNPEKAALLKRRATLKRHGMTVEDYEREWTAQGGRCANPGCGREFPLAMASYRQGLMVDHDHATRRFRGLLCPGCNLALGFAKEDPRRLSGLAEYIRDRSPKTLNL